MGSWPPERGSSLQYTDQLVKGLASGEDLALVISSEWCRYEASVFLDFQTPKYPRKGTHVTKWLNRMRSHLEVRETAAHRGFRHTRACTNVNA